MPTSSSNTQSPASGASQAPAIRTFQLDDQALGQLPSAVNLFRGDINLPLELFSLPGRHEDSGVNVSMSLMYQSNVFRDAQRWNRDAPTSVVGLGWSLPLTWIEAADGGSPDPETRSYTFYENGTPSQLVRQSEQPPIVTLANTSASGLSDGAPLPAAIRQGLAAAGIPVSASATVSGGSSPWTVVDDALQQELLLTSSGADLLVSWGGQAFQLMGYRFYQILYFATWERWLIVTDKGLRQSLGGLGGDTAASIRWDVWWGTEGKAAWRGPSTNTEGQVQVASAWYLSSTSDRFGDTATFDYDTVEQAVGEGGQSYTKAVYLKGITDVFGRRVTLEYGDKIWDDSSPEAPREYADPHRATPSTDPDAYQDRYETRYLKSIAVADSQGAALLSVQLDYAPRPEVSGPDQAVANVTDFTGSLQGDTFKRFLTGVTILNGDGDAQPGYEYAYYLDADDEGGQPGALKAITFPEGAVATYTYTAQDLDVCDREQVVEQPSGVGSGATPRVFYGDDYTISTWYDASSQTLSLQTFTWKGRWIPWQLADSAVLDTGGVQLDTLEVFATSDFFALYFERSSEGVVYVFNRDPARPGQFAAATIDGVTTAENTPNLTLDLSSGQLGFALGTSYFAVSQMNTTAERYAVTTATWSWETQSWTTRQATPSEFTWITGSGEYLLSVDAKGKVGLSWLDGEMQWRDADPLTLPGFSVSSYTDLALSPGASLVALSNLQVDSPSQRSYEVTIVQWDADHALADPSSQTFTDAVATGTPPLTWTPAVVSDRFVAINGNLMRFDGQSWLVNTALNVQGPGQGTIQRYGYGPDYALQVIEVNGNASANVLGFDAQTVSGDWSTQPSQPLQSLPPSNSPGDNWPSGGAEDYAIIGPYVFFRGSSTDWGAVVGQDALADLGSLAGEGFESESLVNETPGFLAYAVFPGGNPQDRLAQALLLWNGQVSGDPQTLKDQRVYTPTQEPSTDATGVNPAGPQMVVSYPSSASNFDSATRIHLHRWAGDAIDGPIQHYPVTLLEIDDGFGDLSSTAYAPDGSTAGCDSSGLVVNYYKNTSYPGATDPASAPCGGVESTYVNGVEDVTGPNYYNMLDGMLLGTRTLAADGTVLESQANTWWVTQQVASDPNDPKAPPIQLRGGFVAQTAQDDMRDGVSRTQSMSYIKEGLPGPYTGRPVTSTVTSTGGEGKTQVFTEATTAGVEVNANLRAWNLRGLDAQVTTMVAVDGAAALPVTTVATTYDAWPSALGEGVKATAEEAAFRDIANADAGFPFASYQPGDTPEGWLLDSRVTGRSAYGQVAQSEDACGVVTSTILSTNAELVIAQIANAECSGGAYLGFQSYEDDSGWTLQGSVTDTTVARTGTQSLRMPGGGQAKVSRAVTPAADAGVYVVGLWYRTDQGFTPVSGTGLKVTRGGQSKHADFDATEGEWALLTLGVEAPSGAQAASALTLEVDNGSNSSIWLDAVWAVPLVGGMIARTFDEATQQVTSVMDAAGRTRWTAYDRFQEPTLQVGPDGNVKELAQRFQSRLGSSDGAFDPASPNAESTLHPAGSSTVETFLDGGAWASRWAPSPAADWQASGGALSHSGQSGTLSYQPSVDDKDTWALYFEVQAGDDSPALSLNAGDLSIGWDGATWSGEMAGSAIKPLGEPPQMARHWLLIVGDGVTLFYGDGQLLFSSTVAVAATAPVLTTSSDLSLRHLALMDAPRFGTWYNDGAKRQRQVQQLWGSDSRVSEFVFDGLDRQVAATKAAPGSFGSGAKQPVMQYRPDFVDVADFLRNLDATGVMKGDVADYYGGDHGRSDDQGYPYFGTRYEASPRERKVELGNPGAPYAITDPGTTPPSQRATTQIAYGANDGVTPPLPKDEFNTKIVTTPLKRVSTELTDRLGQGVGQLYADEGGTLVSQTGGARAYDDTQGPETTLGIQLPNALLKGPQSGDASYVTSEVADGAGRTLSRTDPDAGELQFIYDPCGRARFVQPALGRGEQFFIYYKYDAVGRLTEQGTVDQAWDRATLQPLAAEPSWPDASVDHAVAVSWGYDGDGSDPSLIGQKASATTTTAAPSNISGAREVICTETFAYDPSGRLTSVEMTLEGPETAQGTIGYSYTNLGEVAAMSLPETAPVECISYTYNDQGQVLAVGSKGAGSDDLARYTYTAQGDVDTEELGGGAWLRDVTYASPGWVASVDTSSQDGSQSLNMSWDYNADATVASRTIEFALSGAAGRYADTYAYDGRGQLTEADGASDLQITSYDPSGNIWALTQGGTDMSFPLATGTDRVGQTEVGGKTGDVSYDARGRVTSVWGRTLAYDESTSLTTGVGGGDTSVQLAYGGHQQRVLKIATGQDPTTTVYFKGAAQVPVAQLTDGKWSVFVHGPTGLIATIGASSTGYLLKDTQGSPWAVVTSGGDLVARYVYLPFGGLATADGPNPGALSYLFTSQEWDAETGFYNFRDRIYCPQLRRFLAPDPARQFASPYLYAGNNPLVVSDPSGDISVWAQVGIGVAMAAVAVAGVALTLATGGISDAVAASVEASLVTAEVGVETAAVATEVGVGTSVAVGAAEVGVGATVATGAAAEGGAVAATGAAAWAANATYVGLSAVSGALTGAGISGVTYDIQHGRDFTAAGFFEAVGIGAASGFVSGALGGVVGMPATEAALTARGVGTFAQSAIRVGLKGVAGAIGSDLKQVLTNVSQHQPWYQGLAQSTATGFATSAATALGGEAFRNAGTIARGVGVSEQTITRVTTLIDQAKGIATSSDAYAVYATAAFFAVTSYAIWGAADNWGQSDA